MDYQNIKLEKDGAIAILTVDRPKALNALNSATFHEMDHALRSLKGDTRALIVTGGGDKAFVAGADIAEMVTITAAQAREFSALGHHVFQSLENLPIPTIAAVNGFALGGGLELALCCHLRIASTTAKFGLPETKLGLIPGYGGTQRLQRLVGLGRAMQLVLTGGMIDAEEAVRIGLVNAVYPADVLLEKTRAVAKEMTQNGPLALAAAIAAMTAGADLPLDKGLALEAKQFGAVGRTADMREGTSAFLEKRAPKFRGT
jgi:enoyl-CoA hydratase